MSMKYFGMYKVRMATTLVLLGFVLQTLAQESVVMDEHRPMVRGAIMMANSHIPNATEGGHKVAIVPTWGFDVDYFFHPRWSVALRGDIKLQSFEVEHDNVLLERTYPIAVAAVIHYPRIATLVILCGTWVRV